MTGRRSVPVGAGASPTRIDAVLLGSLIALTAVLRLHTYHEPLERDITTYAVIAHELLAGGALYADLWDHKPPAIHATYAAAEIVTGYGPASIWLLNVLGGALTSIGLWAAGRAGWNPATGRWAAVYWTIASGDLYLQGNQPNTELFINAALVWSLYGWLRLTTDRWRGALYRLGLLLVLASLYKPIAVLFAALLAIGHVLSAREHRRRATLQIVMLAAIGATVWALVIGWFAWTDRLRPAIDAIFVYNRAYAGSVVGNWVDGLQLSRLLPGVLLRAQLPLLVALAVGGALRLARGGPVRRPTVLLAGYGIAVPLMVASAGFYWPHYYQLWLPLLALGGARAGQLVAGMVRRRSSAFLVSGGVALGLAVVQAPSYRWTADEWSIRKYGEVFVETRTAAAAVRATLTPDQGLWAWGSETGLYFEAARSPASGVFYVLPLVSGPLQADLSARVVADLERSRPGLILINRTAPAPAGHQVLTWIDAHYVTDGRQVGPFAFLTPR